MKRGYVHFILEQVNEDGKTGGTIYPKAMWPQSTDFSTTVTSSVSNNVTFGKGSSGKIGLDDGAEITYGDSSNASLLWLLQNQLSRMTQSYQLNIPQVASRKHNGILKL